MIMNLQEYLDALNSGEPITAESKVHQYMHKLSQEAIQICTELNNSYHKPCYDKHKYFCR